MLTGHPSLLIRGPNFFSEMQVKVLVIDIDSVSIRKRAYHSRNARTIGGLGDDTTFYPGALKAKTIPF